MVDGFKFTSTLDVIRLVPCKRSLKAVMEPVNPGNLLYPRCPLSTDDTHHIQTGTLGVEALFSSGHFQNVFTGYSFDSKCTLVNEILVFRMSLLMEKMQN